MGKGYTNESSGYFYGGSRFLMSAEQNLASPTKTGAASIPVIPIASGGLVSRVGMYITARPYGAGPDWDVGVGKGGDAAAFFDGLGTIATQRVVWAPNGRGCTPVTGTYLGAIGPEVQGYLFNHPGYILMTINATCTRGSGRVVAEVIDISDID